jgi:protease PrsW
MIYIFYAFFGLAPSIIWLLFYLRKDSHPESNSMILKVFFYGMVSAVFAAAIEIGLTKIIPQGYSLVLFLIEYFVIVSLVEELSKFLVIKIRVLKDPEFDEPVDAMLYMIIAALGFAALENLLYIFPVLLQQEMSVSQAMIISLIRFVGATFLHALCSGTIGFFLAYSIFKLKSKKLLLTFGIFLAATLHGLFNISIIGLEGGLSRGNNSLLIVSIIALVIILGFLATFVSAGFKRLKKIQSICKI